MHLAAAANVLTSAYLAIVSKGYSVSRVGDDIVAERDGDRLIAEDTIQLLGLIALIEIRGEAWQATDDEIEEFTLRFA